MKKKRYDVAVLGEALIDFTDCGLSPAGNRLFEQNPGGAPANVACAVSRQGGRAAFLGKVGDDMHGHFLRDTLRGLGVDVSGLVLDPAVFTTLAFVALGENGERRFSFARRPGADACLTPAELAGGVLEDCAVLHIGSLSMTDEPARSATLRAVELARAAGAAIAYDPNYRPSLWESEAQAVEQMRSLLPLADYVKLSDEETALLTGQADPEKAARALLDRGCTCAVVTLGAGGALAALREGVVRVPGVPARAVDTTGAGDAFWGAFLAELTRNGLAPADLTLPLVRDFARYANAAASLCVEGRGAIPSLPTRAGTQARLGDL